MAVLIPQAIPVHTGLAPDTDPASAGGDEAPVGSNRILYVHNTAGAPVTVTVATPGAVRGLAIADVVAAVAADTVWLLPLKRVFASPTTGRASISYSASAGVEVAVLELTP